MLEPLVWLLSLLIYVAVAALLSMLILGTAGGAVLAVLVLVTRRNRGVRP